MWWMLGGQMKTSSNIQIGKQRVEGGRTVGWMVGRMAKGKHVLSLAWREGGTE